MAWVFKSVILVDTYPKNTSLRPKVHLKVDPMSTTRIRENTMFQDPELRLDAIP